MHVRMMPKQEPPYTRLIDSARRQPEETQEDVNGTVIGFLHLNYSMVLVLVVSIFISPTMIVISADTF